VAWRYISTTYKIPVIGIVVEKLQLYKRLVGFWADLEMVTLAVWVLAGFVV
jgi:hypothetical protein